MAQSNARAGNAGPTAAVKVDEEEITRLAKRHCVSSAVVREIQKGKAQR